jgi:hypothetical protein
MTLDCAANAWACFYPFITDYNPFLKEPKATPIVLYCGKNVYRLGSDPLQCDITLAALGMTKTRCSVTVDQQLSRSTARYH